MIEWLKQQYNNLIFELFPILPSYLVRDCYKEFDEKYKEFRIMTEKRFQYNVNKNTIEQDGKFVAYVNSVDGVRIANKLNVFQKENEQLKSDNNRLVNETAKIIAEHQKKILDLIDKSLEKDKQYYEMSYEDYLNGRIEALQELKKELSE